ncbi:virulence plasmid 65kDa B protein-domain-containing protein, partial [Cercophora newfieldiana]
MASSHKTVPPSVSGGTRKLTTWNPFDKPSTSPATTSTSEGSKGKNNSYYTPQAPSISAPVGGGALRCIDDKFQVNAATGTSSLSIPFAIPPGRGGLGPTVSLSYDSGSGNSPFGLGWSLGLPSISRKTSQGIPKYSDNDETDVFLFTAVEDLVPKISDATGGQGKGPVWVERKDGQWTVREYLPRTEGGFSRIERWFKLGDPSATYWRTISAANVVSFYGRDSNSRVMDQQPTGRIFAWLLCSTYDAHGNAIAYEYKAEDSVGIKPGQAHEAHRTDTTRAVNRHIKSIRYGNTTPAPASARNGDDWLASANNESQWMFEIVFDYGDHRTEKPAAAPDQPWAVRQDVFSTYTPGFELRTYRLCRRFLLFHHMKEQLGVQDYLVRSMELVYKESGSASVLASLTQTSHALDTSLGTARSISRSLPSVEFQYSAVDLSSANVKSAPSSALQNLPSGLSSPVQWVDLDGCGKSSPLVIGETGWFQMKNMSSYRADYHDMSTTGGQVVFGPAEVVPTIPSTASPGTASLLDIGGNGRLDVVQTELGQHGYYERTDEGGWTEFTRFPKWPTVDLGNPNLRYLDLTGNGLADIIIAEADSFVWYPALGTDGYDEAIKVPTAASEQEGPRILFSDGLESIYLTDINGDGLVDLVRIRNGDICYWPNLGYGRFGAKVAMDNAPWMSPHDRFNQGRVQLADIDGSGAADILYFPPDGGLRVYMNQCGNSWSAPVDLFFPLLDSLSNVNIVDLFGLGLSSVVWSTTLPGSQGSSLQYLDFTRGRKPYLLTSSINGPVETRLQYTSSVTLREADERSGRPWATQLPFPVQCLTRMTTYDHLSKVYAETSYKYRDGYYDGPEREFHGFGMVESLMVEHVLLGRNASDAFPTPGEIDRMAGKLSSPVTRTMSWNHLGSWEGAEATRRLQEKEYYHTPALDLDLSVSFREPLLPLGMTPAETRQAYRVLKGTPLRSETYQVDGSEKQHIPISISDNTAGVRMLQRAIDDIHPAIFLVLPGESVTIQLERDDTDPRINHTLPLEIDDWGNVTKSATVAYGRRPSKRTPMHSEEDWKAQSMTLVTYSEQAFTNAVLMDNDHQTPLSFETRTYEVKGVNFLPGKALFTAQDLSAGAIKALKKKEYTDLSDSPGVRLISRSHTRFRANDLSRVLGPSVLESLAIPGESYTLAMTPDVVKLAFHGPTTPSSLNDPTILGGTGESDGGYVDLESDGSWWIPSGHSRFSTDANATPVQELDAAKASFFQPVRFVDPFGNATTVTYDVYRSFVVSTRDAVGNTTRASIDYRTLQPHQVTDQNGNQTLVAFDVFGQCVGGAAIGKPLPELGTGDSLDGFQPNMDPQTVLGLLSDPASLSALVLGKCTSVSFSGPPTRASGKGASGWNPGFSIFVARNTHVARLEEGEQPQIQVSVSYSDGRGQPLQTRTLASEMPGPEQWVVGGVTVANSAGKALREYDVAFTASPGFGPLPDVAVYSSSFFDSSGRCVASILPNRTWTKTVHGAWTQVSYDPGDTVLIQDPSNDPDVGIYLSTRPEVDLLKPTWHTTMTNSTSPLDRRIAQQCSGYANRPTETWLDTMGQAMLSMVDSGGEDGKHISRCYTDRQGRIRKVIDAEGRLVGVSDFDMVGTCVHAISMDTGESWVVNDVMGLPIRTCNARQVQERTCYDAMRRPVKVMTRVGFEERAKEITSQALVYGEGQEDAERRNLRGKLYECRDQGTVLKSLEYDYLGNAVRESQQLVRAYKGVVDWAAADVEMEERAFVWQQKFDALGRNVSKTRSDGSVVTNVWDAGGRMVGLRVSGGRGAKSEGHIIRGIEYNARGQRVRVKFGNGSECRYTYHPTSFWMTSKTVVTGGGTAVLDLRYAYDCMGRAARIEDLAQQDIFFRGEVVKPVQEFEYDAIGRLRKASGREHIGQARKNWKGVPTAVSAARDPSPSDGKAMVNYTETYRYSPEGNILSIAHTTSDSTAPGWTRTFQYAEPSPIEKNKFNNRLSSTTVGSEVSTYKYEGLAGAMGLITSMSGFPLLQYDLSNRLCASSTQQQSATAIANGDTPETTWYRYDSSSQRVRKISERAAVASQEPSRSKDHWYLKDGIDIFRKYSGGDDEGRVLSTEANVDFDPGESGEEGNLRGDDEEVKSWSGVVSMWVITDHASSATLELDDSGVVISHEEFSPYGSTTYDASANLDVDKRYRYA